MHVTKNHLSKKILHSIKINHGNSSINIKLNELLTEIEILYQRELFDQCLFQISKAEKLAEEFEKNEYLSIIYGWIEKIAFKQQNWIKHKNNIFQILQKQKKVLNNGINEVDYWNLLILQLENMKRTKKEEDEFFTIPHLREISNASTLRSKINFFHIHYLNEIASNNQDSALKLLDELIILLERYPKRISEDPSSYITTLTNKISMLLGMKKYELLPELLTKIRNVPSKYNLEDKDKISVSLNLRTYNVELEMFRDLSQFDEGKQKIEEIQNFLIENEKSISEEYICLFQYQFAYIYFMSSEYDKALSWTNRLLQSDYSKVREDIHNYTRFLNLMIHYELGNFLFIKYATEAARKNIKKRRSLLDFEKKLLRFFSKISLEKRENFSKLFNQLGDTIFENTDKSKVDHILDYIDFYSWIKKNTFSFTKDDKIYNHLHEE